MRMNVCPSPETHCDHGYGRRNQCLFYGTGCYCRHRKTNLVYDRGGEGVIQAPAASPPEPEGAGGVEH